MATIKWAEICDHVILEQKGKIGLLGLFDMIFGSNFPLEWPDFWIICKVEGMPNERVLLEVDFRGPDGEILGHVGPMEGVVGPAGGTYVGGRIFRPTFPKPGRYEVRIRPAGNPSTSLFLTVQQLPTGESSQQE